MAQWFECKVKYDKTTGEAQIKTVSETYLVDAPALKNGAIDHVALNVNDIEAAWSDAQACGYETEDTAINFLPFFERGVKFFTIIGPNREKVEFNQYL